MKKVLMINGNPRTEDGKFDAYCDELSQVMASQGHDVRTITLREKEIADCIGCYACWLKTPGICALDDDQQEILQGYVWADFVILASPLIMGFTSALLKKVNDRLIPLMHPFLKLADDRMAHIPRYEKDFPVGLLVDNHGQLDTDDLEIIQKVYNKATFLKTMQQDVGEVADEINNY